MKSYIQKGFKNGKPIAYCIHQIIGKKDICTISVVMKNWKTIDKKGKIEQGIACPKCYRSEHITI